MIISCGLELHLIERAIPIRVKSIEESSRGVSERERFCNLGRVLVRMQHPWQHAARSACMQTLMACTHADAHNGGVPS